MDNFLCSRASSQIMNIVWQIMNPIHDCQSGSNGSLALPFATPITLVPLNFLPIR
uniref:Uncharacterized protein n=1 Tax=Arundo donax TaxID=35708 RepID=A0A0A8XUD8_ARUDO